MPWQNQDLAELYRVRDRLCEAGLSVEVEGGVSDEGDPWFVYQQAETDMVVVHIARIDTYIHVVNCITGTAYTGSSFREVSDRMLDDAPVVLGARIRRASNVVMHPSAFLTAFVAAALMLLDAPVEAKAETGDGADHHTPTPTSHHHPAHESAGLPDAATAGPHTSTGARRLQKEAGPQASQVGPSLAHAHLAEMSIGTAGMTLSASLIVSELMHMFRQEGVEHGHEIDPSLFSFFVTSSEALLGASRGSDVQKTAFGSATASARIVDHDGVPVEAREGGPSDHAAGGPKLVELHLEKPLSASAAADVPVAHGQVETPTISAQGNFTRPAGGEASKAEVPVSQPVRDANPSAAVPDTAGSGEAAAHAPATHVADMSASTAPSAPAASVVMPVKADLVLLVKAAWISAADALPPILTQDSAYHPANLAPVVVRDTLALVSEAPDLASTTGPAESAAAPDTDVHHVVSSDADMSITFLAGRRDVIHYNPTVNLVLDGFVMGEDVIVFADTATGDELSATARQVGDDLVMGLDGGDTVRIVGVLADVLHVPTAIAA